MELQDATQRRSISLKDMNKIILYMKQSTCTESVEKHLGSGSYSKDRLGDMVNN